MRLSENKLRRIVKEEIGRVLREQDRDDSAIAKVEVNDYYFKQKPESLDSLARDLGGEKIGEKTYKFSRAANAWQFEKEVKRGSGGADEVEIKYPNE